MATVFLAIGAAFPVRAQTPSFAAGARVGTNNNGALPEVSGLAASRRNPNVLWVHNDSGHPACLYALNPQGRLHGTYTLTGAGSDDWEDIALASDPVDGLDYVYAGNIGDNYALRDSVTVYRVREPFVNTNQFGVSSNLVGVQTYIMTYSDGARDAETLLVDPWNGDIYVVSKRESLSRVYRAPYPHSTSSIITLQYKTNLVFPGAVAGDVSPCGRQILIKAYPAIAYYARADGASLEDTLATTPVAVPYTSETCGEAVGWEGKERGYYTLSEGVGEPVYYYASADTDGDGLADTLEVAANTEMDNGDSDGDHQSDGGEVAAGTSPTNAASFFSIEIARRDDGTLSLQWYARTNRLYDVYAHDGPLSNGASVAAVATGITTAADGLLSTNLPPDGEVRSFGVSAQFIETW